MGRLGFLFDQTRCIGCNACQMACRDKNNLEQGQFFRRAVTVETGTLDEFGMPQWEHYSGACNHCKEAACVRACPNDAMVMREDGTVGHEDSKCIGCGSCVWACPYGAVSLSRKKGIAEKCNSCEDLRKQGRNPACVDACITHCLEFTDLDQLPEQVTVRVVRERPYLPDPSLTDPTLAIIPKKGGI